MEEFLSSEYEKRVEELKRLLRELEISGLVERTGKGYRTR